MGRTPWIGMAKDTFPGSFDSALLPAVVPPSLKMTSGKSVDGLKTHPLITPHQQAKIGIDWCPGAQGQSLIMKLVERRRPRLR
jgi:hypothetical protein